MCQARTTHSWSGIRSSSGSSDPAAFHHVLVKVVRVLSARLRRTNELLSSVGHLADWLAGSLV